MRTNYLWHALFCRGPTFLLSIDFLVASQCSSRSISGLPGNHVPVWQSNKLDLCKILWFVPLDSSIHQMYSCQPIIATYYAEVWSCYHFWLRSFNRSMILSAPVYATITLNTLPNFKISLNHIALRTKALYNLKIFKTVWWPNSLTGVDQQVRS